MLPDGLYFELLKHKKNKTKFDEYCIGEFKKTRKIIIGLLVFLFFLMIITFFWFD